MSFGTVYELFIDNDSYSAMCVCVHVCVLDIMITQFPVLKKFTAHRNVFVLFQSYMHFLYLKI